MPKVNVTDVTDALGVITQSIPVLQAAYAMGRLIFLATNPGKTEEDYLNVLGTQSTQTTTDADNVLVSLGYAQDANGNWHKPPVAVPPAA